MYEPLIKYLVSSPYGDEPVDKDKLDFPLESDLLKTSYRVYFDSIRNFISQEEFKPILVAAHQKLKRDVLLREISEIIVRTEKHGALYHPASIEVAIRNSRIKFGLNVAVTDTGKDALKKEFVLLKTLLDRFNLPYIPRPYYVDELNSMVFLLEEWFEDYHEFHIAKTEDGKQQVKLWEYGKGNRFLSPEQSFEIYRQASQILTLYYDLNSFRLIYPWHHAAGDFVVRVEHEKIDVRLTTARGYEPFMGFDEDNIVNPALALFYFLLHLSIQMRLDKLDGLGDIVWADDTCVDATLTGFFQVLEQKNDFKICCGSATTFLNILKSFKKTDLRATFKPLLDQYEQTKDFHVIRENLEDHIGRLYLTLRIFPR